MPNEIYGAFEFAAKSYTRGSDIGKGAVGIQNINPALFLELRLIKSHTHTGVDSLKLTSEATPESVRGYTRQEREERGTATWTGGSASSGSLTLTFGTAFLSAPTVYITAADGNADILVGVGSVTASSVTIYWKDGFAGTHTTLDLYYLAKGR